MTLHVRAQIRAAMVAALTGLTTTGIRVYSGRARALPQGHDPSLLVYAVDEVSEAHGLGRPAPLLRTLTLRVEGRVSNVGPPDDDLDVIAAEVEVAIAADPTFAALALDTMLIATRISAEAPGERYAGEVAMDFQVLYRTRENAPGVAV